MKFIHIADVHLGAGPDAGSSYTENRGAELWNSFERIIGICEKEKADLLLIAGDLFHRQPLLRELKEVNYLLASLSRTQVVLIAGNHDYLKDSSFYRTFSWNKRVHMLLGTDLEYVEFPELETCVYGFSYDRKEITEPKYDQAVPGNRQKTEILIAHGGDEKHIPVNFQKLTGLGYDYIAMGHIHRPMLSVQKRVGYAGSLEPTDKNDTGAHGYIKGEIRGQKLKAEFVPFASREYIHLEVTVEKEMAGHELRDRIASEIKARGVQNIYKVILKGFKDPDILYDFGGMDPYGNVLEFVDCTRPAYNFERLEMQNKDNLLGMYIERLKDSEEDSIENQALFEGVRALLETKRGA